MKKNNLKNLKILFFVVVIVVLASLFLTSCTGITEKPYWIDLLPSTSPNGSSNIQYVKLLDIAEGDVFPFVGGSISNWCFFNCLAMVYKYYGDNISAYESSEYVLGSDNWITRVKTFSSSKGFIAKYGILSIDNVRYYLQNKIPIILNCTHAHLIIGYDDIEEVFIQLYPTGFCCGGSNYSSWGNLASYDSYANENYDGYAQPCWVIYPK